jgi:hypothetical protein
MRCIEFIANDGIRCASSVTVQVDFSGMPATGLAAFNVECDSWTHLCAKDEQHTLVDTTSLNDTGGVLDSEGTLVLLGGDTDNDSDVDINDVTYTIWTYGEPAADGGCAWDGTRDADFDNDGAVSTGDYTFFVENWHEFGHCGCGALTGSDGAPRAMEAATLDVRRSLDTSRLSRKVARRLDLNDDGVFDFRDVREFEERHGLGNGLSLKMRRTRDTAQVPTVRRTGR